MTPKTTTTAGTTTTAPVASAPAGEQATGDPVPSSGCGQASTSAEPVTVQKEYLDDSDRWFLLTTPPDVTADDPVPLVLDFHGLAEGAEIHSQVSNFAPFAQEHGFIVVQPQGEGSPSAGSSSPRSSTNTDLQYTSDLLDQLEAEHCIDTSRIYATGLSNGAFMSSILGCTMADRVAAIAPVAGLIRPSACDPSRPVPVLTFHGTEDPILLFNGGVGNRLNNVLGGGKEEEPPLPEPDLDGPGYPTAAQDWAEGNGCSGDGTDSELTETVTARVWDCPADGARRVPHHRRRRPLLARQLDVARAATRSSAAPTRRSTPTSSSGPSSSGSSSPPADRSPPAPMSPIQCGRRHGRKYPGPGSVELPRPVPKGLVMHAPLLGARR